MGIWISTRTFSPLYWPGLNLKARTAAREAADSASSLLSSTWMDAGSVVPSGWMTNWVTTVPPIPAFCSRLG
jgi:hypothetical protein